MRFGIALVLAVVLLCPLSAQVQTCSKQTVTGTYGFVCSGFASGALPAGLAASSVLPIGLVLPFSAIGTVTGGMNRGINADFVGGGKVSLGGNIMDQAVTGTALLNSNCTGTISYTQTFNGNPAPPLNIVFHVLDEGKEIRGMSVDPGSNITCNLRLITR